MPRAVWSHFNDRSRIQIEFQLAASGQKVVCNLIADSGAGNKRSTIDPPLGFNQLLRVVGVPAVPAGFDGIASFRFLNRFTYGNFGDPDQFGIEM